jgi:hypothetical protein
MDLVHEVSSYSTSFPIYQVLVRELDDPDEAFDTALSELEVVDDKKTIFRVLWDAARTIGSNNCQCTSEARKRGYEEGKRAMVEEQRKKLIEEGQRVGFEEGKAFRLAQAREDDKKRRRQMISVSVDTRDLTRTPTYISSTAQTNVKTHSPPIASENKLNWADESDNIPPTSPPRDISALRSNNSSICPFNSLQRRARRSWFTSRNTHQFIPTLVHMLHSHPRSQSYPIITRRHPHGLGAHRPIQTFMPSSSLSFPHPKPVFLDWVGDPRLMELSRVLRELGWVHM